MYERTEQEIVAGAARELAGIDEPWEELVAGVRAYLGTCEDPRVARISLIDAPGVLGWAEWREIGDRHALGAVTAALTAAMDTGVLRRANVEQLAHLLLAALAEAALLVANAEHPTAARAEVEDTVIGLLSGLRA